MKKNVKTDGFRLIIADLLFALFLFLYLFYVINMRVIYHGGGAITSGPAFFQGMETFNKFAFSPGGLVRFASSFLAQFFYLNWLGSLIIALLGFVMCRQLLYVIRKTNSGFNFLRFTAPVVLLCLYLRYTFFFNEQLAIVLTLLLICIYLRFSDVVGVRKVLLVVFFCIAAYWLCQGGGIIFALVAGIYELLIRKSWRDSAVLLLTGLLLPYVLSCVILNQNILIAYSGLLGFTPNIQVFEPRPLTLIPLYILFVLPVALIFTGFLRGAFRKTATGFAGSMRLKVAGFVVGNLIVICTTAGLCLGYHDKIMQAVFRTDYYAAEKKWEQLIDYVNEYVGSPGRNFLGYNANNYVITSANLALCNLNRMGYDLFLYPQNPRTLFLSMKARFAYSRRADIYMDMGLLNMAEHQLLEALEVVGERPAIYQRLVLIYMAKDNLPNAVIYLKRLKKLFFYNEWASHYLKKIETDPTLSNLGDIRYLRGMMLDDSASKAYASFFLERNPALSEEMIIELLKKRSGNRMAFEYLLSFYMLMNNLQKFVDTFDEYIGNFNYKVLPPLWQQAIVTYYSNRADRDKKIKKYPISQEQFIFYQNYMTIFSKYNKREPAVWELAKDFGKTYYFYCMYGFSGAK
ncbi:MAG: hypothetical protein KAS96_09360 [Planctomycetes bacterium]|nr:hypothetical protein [Planctomycetota bacterium]